MIVYLSKYFRGWEDFTDIFKYYFAKTAGVDSKVSRNLTMESI